MSCQLSARRWPFLKLAIVPVLYFLQLPVAQREALAFNFDEHRAIGDAGFTQACSGQQASPDAADRVGRLIPGASPCSSILLAGRRTYGELVALSGDIIESPYTFTDSPSQLEDLSRSATDYLRLAHFNKSHFSPHSVRAYQFWHRTALLEAMSATTPGDGVSIDREHFYRALEINAFADHFLQDSFAAGHIRTDRAALPDRLAKKLHDSDNEANKKKRAWQVQNQAGEVWWPLGDGHLQLPEADKDSAEFKRIADATKDSVNEVFDAALHPEQWCSKIDAGNHEIEKSAFAALRRVPQRPACTEEPSVLGDTSCFSPDQYGDNLSLGVGTDQWIGLGTAGQTFTATVSKAIRAYFGFELQIDVWERMSNRTTEFIGATSWLPSVRPGLFLRSWPRRESYTGFEWLYGARLSYPLFWGAGTNGGVPRLRDNYRSGTFPDFIAYFNVILYSLDVRLEMGFGTFLGVNEDLSSGLLASHWQKMRGGKLGLSALYTW